MNLTKRNFWRDSFFSERVWWMRHYGGVVPPALPIDAECPACLRGFIDAEDRIRIAARTDSTILINKIIEDSCAVSLPCQLNDAPSVRIGDLERILKLHLHQQEPSND